MGESKNKAGIDLPPPIGGRRPSTVRFTGVVTEDQSVVDVAPDTEAEVEPDCSEPSTPRRIPALALLALIAIVLIIALIMHNSVRTPSVAETSLANSVASRSTPVASPAAQPDAANMGSATSAPTAAPSAQPTETPASTAQAAATPDTQQNDAQAQAKFQEGWNQGQQGNLDASIEAYREAVDLKPDYADAWQNLADSYTKRGESQKAIDAYRQAVGANPKLVAGWFNLALCYIAAGDAANTDDAIGHLNLLDSGKAQQLLGTLSTDLTSKIAISRYPPLGVLNSPFNLEYRRRYDYYRASNPDYFSNKAWPLLLATETSDAMSNALVPAQISGDHRPSGPGKDFRWNGTVYRVPRQVWNQLNAEVKVFNSESARATQLSAQLYDLEAKINNASWLDRIPLNSKYKALQKEWDKNEKAREAQSSTIEGTLMSGI